VNRAIYRLAIPALGALAIDPLLTLADTAFVARLGVTDLAALGVDTAILGFAFFGFNFLAIVTTPLVAQALGRGDREGAKRWGGDALTLAVILGIPVALLLFFAAPYVVNLMGARGDIVDPAVTYLRIRTFATPAVLLVTASHGSFRGHHDTRTPLYVALLVNALNLILDPLLIFGLGWGLGGAAVATVAAQWVGALVFLRLLIRNDMVSRPRNLADAIPTLITMGRNGVLVTIRTAALLIAFTFAASRATHLGPESIAAHQLVVQVWLLASMLADAYAIAGQVMIGEAVGHRDVPQIHAISKRLMYWGIGVGGFLLVVFWFSRGILPTLARDEGVGDLAVDAGSVAAWMQPLTAPLFVADGIFLGLLAFGALVASTGLGSIVAVSLMAFTPMGNSLRGIWWTIFAMMVVRGFVFVFTYRRSVTGSVRS
jgi:MATE family, multidrug efflux pump